MNGTNSGPVAQALAGSRELEAKFTTFRNAAHEALGEELVSHVRHAVFAVHGVASPEPSGECPPATLAYARRIPFEHTAISDAEAAAVVGELGEAGYAAFSVVAALADAECRAEKLDLPGLANMT